MLQLNQFQEIYLIVVNSTTQVSVPMTSSNKARTLLHLAGLNLTPLDLTTVKSLIFIKALWGTSCKLASTLNTAIFASDGSFHFSVYVSCVCPCQTMHKINESHDKNRKLQWFLDNAVPPVLFLLYWSETQRTGQHRSRYVTCIND